MPTAASRSSGLCQIAFTLPCLIVANQQLVTAVRYLVRIYCALMGTAAKKDASSRAALATPKSKGN